MALISLSEVQSLPDPANAWAWTASIILANPLNIGALDNSGIALGASDNIDRRYVQDVTLPMPQLSPMARYRGGSTLTFPGQSSWSPCAITFYESSSFYVLQTLLTWQQQIYGQNNTQAVTSGNYGLPKDYFGQITIQHFDNQGNQQLEADIIGVWPLNLHDLALNYTAMQNLPITCIFAVNTVKYTFGSAGQTVYGPDDAFGNTSADDISVSASGS